MDTKTVVCPICKTDLFYVIDNKVIGTVDVICSKCTSDIGEVELKNP